MAARKPFSPPSPALAARSRSTIRPRTWSCGKAAPAGVRNAGAFFRGAGGADRVSSWTIGDHSLVGGSSSSALGTNDFTGGTVDVLVDTLALGRSQSTSNANSIGVLTFTSGTIDANTLQ